MNCYSKKYVNLVAFIIAVILLIQINILIVILFQIINVAKQEDKEVVQTNITQEKKEWNLSIPKINVFAKIEEGTSQEIINTTIGHFKETAYIEGNIGLMGGSNGYQNNYFKDLEKLENGDFIFYQYQGKQKEYKVIVNTVIEEKDWSYLTNTKENKLTLITGIKEQPQKRRCVQAIEL